MSGRARPDHGCAAVPIYQTTSYEFHDADHAENLFALAEFGNIYTRIMNPTQGRRGAARRARGRVHHGDRSARCARRRSGQSASTSRAEHRRVRRPHGRLVVAVRRHLQPVPLHAAEARHRGDLRRDPDDLEPGRPRPTDQGVLRRGHPEPEEQLARHQGRSDVAHGVGVPLIVDNTVRDPVPDPAARARRRHRRSLATKFLGGHGTSIGGPIVDGGNFDWRRRELPGLHRARPELPRPGYWPALGHGSLHHQGARAAAPRPRRGYLAVQRLQLLRASRR